MDQKSELNGARKLLLSAHMSLMRVFKDEMACLINEEENLLVESLIEGWDDSYTGGLAQVLSYLSKNISSVEKLMEVLENRRKISSGETLSGKMFPE